MKKTIEEWSKEFNVIIVDPDGFDRKDPRLPFLKFTKEEFQNGMIKSSICPRKKSENK